MPPPRSIIPWIAANASPHSVDYSGTNQAVFHHKGIQIGAGVRDNVAHDGISAAGEVVGQVDNALVVCETIPHQHVIWEKNKKEQWKRICFLPRPAAYYIYYAYEAVYIQIKTRPSKYRDDAKYIYLI